MSPEESSCICLFFGKILSRKSNNVIFFPFAFHIAVHQPFRSLWCACCYTIMNCPKHHLLCASCHCCCCHPESEEFFLEFPSPRHLGSSSICPLHLSGLLDLIGGMLPLTYLSQFLQLTCPSITARWRYHWRGGVNGFEDILFEFSKRSELTAS